MKDLKQHEKDFIHISKKGVSWAVILLIIVMIDIYFIVQIPFDAKAIFTALSILLVSNGISIICLMEIADLNNLDKED